MLLESQTDYTSHLDNEHNNRCGNTVFWYDGLFDDSQLFRIPFSKLWKFSVWNLYSHRMLVYLISDVMYSCSTVQLSVYSLTVYYVHFNCVW